MAADRRLGFVVLLCSLLLLHSAASETKNQGKCPGPFQCGKLGNDGSVEFPFTTMSSECGLLINGCDKPDPEKEVEIGKRTYKIESIFQDDNNTIFIHEAGCSTSFGDFLMLNEMMSLHVVNRVAFFMGKRPYVDNQPHPNLSKYTNCSDFDVYYSSDLYLPRGKIEWALPSMSDPCSRLPYYPTNQCQSFASFLEIEVTLSKPCEKCYYAEKGRCHLDKERLNCDTDDAANYTHSKGWASKAVIVGLSIGLAGMTTIALCAILLLYKRRHSSSHYQNKTRNIYSGSNSNTNPESRNVYFGIPVFSYEELQEATNNFDQVRELGEGGFGIVYYGKLRDGREVAVKRLNERNYRPVESFINEIQILTRLRHKNLVSLYGCTSRHSRELLLVYEFVSNGTVSYHLHGDKSKSGLLPWHVRMKIAIETANALAYLHASDIIHRDVKTSNILLDSNFGVKVADFGLSRLFPADVTHISTAPRGTPGYVDPDYRLCYQLTSKSDVYSFGVVLVELISSLPAVDMNRDRDEIKLANLALRNIEKGAFCELIDPDLGFWSDDKSRRMMISVAKLAFQCLQGDKDLRPSMCEVLEVLQRIESGKEEPGNLEGIEVHDAGVSLGNSHPLLPNTLIKPKRQYQTL